MAIWMFFMPRSPVFLITKRNIDEARKSLQYLRGKKANIEKELGPVKLFSTKEYVKPIGICLVLMFLQQLSGVLFIYSYLALIFEVNLSLDNLDSYFISELW